MIVSLGLDLSATAPGVAALQGNLKAPVALGAFEIPVPTPDKIGRWERVDLIGSEVAKVVEAYQPGVIVIEGYGQGSHKGVQSFIKLVEVGTIVRMVLWAKGLTWMEVPPQSLKKFVTGNGSATKKEMIRGVRENWGIETKSHNVADAIGLAAIGLARRGMLRLNGYQADVLDRLQSGA